jgi:hypothetical protein
MTFSKFIELYNYLHNLIVEHFNHHQKNLMTICNHSLFPPSLSSPSPIYRQLLIYFLSL